MIPTARIVREPKHWSTWLPASCQYLLARWHMVPFHQTTRENLYVQHLCTWACEHPPEER